MFTLHGQTVFDRLESAARVIQEMSEQQAEGWKVSEQLDSILTDISSGLADIRAMLSHDFSKPEDIEEKAAALSEWVDVAIDRVGDLQNAIGVEWEDPEVDSLQDEIKQVGLSTIAGNTSPIDLGNWLY